MFNLLILSYFLVRIFTNVKGNPSEIDLPGLILRLFQDYFNRILIEE